MNLWTIIFILFVVIGLQFLFNLFLFDQCKVYLHHLRTIKQIAVDDLTERFAYHATRIDDIIQVANFAICEPRKMRKP